jgi:FKBP12-rapamycin complex-associated protein
VNDLNQISLPQASPILAEMINMECAVPGTYIPNKEIIRISKIERDLVVLQSKQKPRQMKIIGSDGNSYLFLLKANEDMRLDQRVMQIFLFMNSITTQMKLTTYHIIS